MVLSAKSVFIKSKLRENSADPKKFWRVINNILNPSKGKQTDTMHFYGNLKDTNVEPNMAPDFLNDYFLNILTKLGIEPSVDLCEGVYDIHNRFCFSDDMPTIPEVLKLVKDIDVNKSGCVEKISTRFCKDAMLAIPDIVCKLCCKSLETGIMPRSRTKGVINVIPKDGDLSDPGNWRPITQTSVLAKLLEKLKHKRLLSYFFNNNIISDFQFGFFNTRTVNPISNL